MADRYDDELKLVLEDLADLMQNEASPKKNKMLHPPQSISDETY